MRIAINILPLKSAHKERGVGHYTRNLLEVLKDDDSIQIQEFTKLSEIKDVDVIHYPWFDLFFHTLPLKRPFPTIITIHDVIPLIFPEHYPVGIRGKINFFLQRLALKSCESIITDSQTSKDDIVKYLKLAPEKVRTVPLAVDQNFRALSDAKLINVKRKYNLPDQFLLYVGDANWVKNLPFLIRAFNETIKNPTLEDVKLVLIGGVFLKNVENIIHPELESLRLVNRLIKDFGIANWVIRPGHIGDEELVAFYNLATVYIQPSLYEGFGLPVLEAMSCGTPVVCSKGGSLPEVGGDAAVYFNTLNLEQFVSIVSDILQNKSLQAKLSKLGLKQAAKFSWDKAISEIKSAYEEVIRK